MGVLDGSLTIGDVVFLQTILGMAFAPLFNMGNIYIRFQESIVELRDVVELMNVPRLVTEKPDAAPMVWKNGDIQLKNISYKIGDRFVNQPLYRFSKTST